MLIRTSMGIWYMVLKGNSSKIFLKFSGKRGIGMIPPERNKIMASFVTESPQMVSVKKAVTPTIKSILKYIKYEIITERIKNKKLMPILMGILRINLRITKTGKVIVKRLSITHVILLKNI